MTHEKLRDVRRGGVARPPASHDAIGVARRGCGPADVFITGRLPQHAHARHTRKCHGPPRFSEPTLCPKPKWRDSSIFDDVYNYTLKPKARHAHRREGGYPNTQGPNFPGLWSLVRLCCHTSHARTDTQSFHVLYFLKALRCSFIAPKATFTISTMHVYYGNLTKRHDTQHTPVWTLYIPSTPMRTPAHAHSR